MKLLKHLISHMSFVQVFNAESTMIFIACFDIYDILSFNSDIYEIHINKKHIKKLVIISN